MDILSKYSVIGGALCRDREVSVAIGEAGLVLSLVKDYKWLMVEILRCPSDNQATRGYQRLWSKLVVKANWDGATPQ